MTETVEHARLTPQTGNRRRIIVQFNPVSLQYTINNTLQEQSDIKTQYVTKSSAKLTMDLIFDTTPSGQDVRVKTEEIARFMIPEQQGGHKIPTVILFEWGTFTFKGYIESYKETLDFFSPTGIPLRATVNLTLARQDVVFTPDRRKNKTPYQPAVTMPVAGESMTDMTARGGNPDAARDAAAANNQDSIRFPSGPIALSDEIPLRSPVAFATASAGAGLAVGAGFGASAGAGFSAGVGLGASAGAGFGASAGASAGVGFSASAGAGFSAGAGLGVSASTGFGASATAGFGRSASAGFGATAGMRFGSSASAGVAASAGAFGGLRTATRREAIARLDVQQYRQRRESFSYATSSRDQFAVGGQASLQASAGFRADVGATASLRSRIQFDGG